MKRALCLAAGLLLALPLFGQSNTGTIQGTVTDPSGAVVSGATVTARNLDTGLSFTANSSSAGIYSIPNLPPGRYAVSADFTGMKEFIQNGVTITVGSTTSLNISMELGARTQTVVVNADAQQLETATSDIGATVERPLIENLPLEVSGTVRNPVQFITLVPGFVGNVSNNPGSNNTDDFKVNGGQETATDILVDGVSISLVSPNTQMNKGISTDAVQEFKVLQSNFSPEYGESGDGIVSLTLKSGTNQFHGSAYDYLRNRALDANSWTNNTLGLPRSVNTQNDFGGTAGGPIYIPKFFDGRDKSFFFVAYEGFRFRTGGTSLLSLPPESFRNGDFSALLQQTNPLQLYDPTTHNPISGNLLSNDPNYVESKVIKSLFGLLPPTNGGLTNNVVDPTVSKTSADIFDIKWDQKIFSSDHLSVGFDYDNTDTGGFSSLSPLFGQNTPQDTRYFRISDDHIFSPSVVNHFLAGFSRRFRGEISNTLGQDYVTKIGLTGVQNTTLPCFIFVGTPYENALNNCGDSEFADNVFQYSDSVSWVKGKHEIKFGGEARFLQFNVRRLTQSSAEFDFNALQTANAAGQGGEAVATAMFGLVNQSEFNYGSFSGVRYKDYAMFAQDTYRILPKLTLNYGLRYDTDIPASEAYNRFSAVDPTLPNPGAGNILGAYTYFGSGPGRNGRTRPQDVYHKAFGPRIGFAYSINDKTVIRGGYGIFYEPLKEGSFADQDGLGFFNKETITTANLAPYQIDSGVPHFLPPSGPFTPDGQNGNSGVILVPPDTGRPADIQSWNLDVQRQISSSLLVSIAYVGSKGTHLPALNIIPNQVNPTSLSLGSDLLQQSTCLALGPTGPCPNAVAAGVTLPYPTFTGTIAQALRPFPQYGDFNQEDNSFSPDRTGNSTYHAMQLEVNKRISQGLSFLVSYTVSKNLTDADASGPGVSGFTGTNEFIGQNSYDRRAEKAVSELDTPQSLVASFVYDLPFGHDRKYLSSSGSLVDHAVSGWYVSGILTYSSGQPTEVYAPCGGTAGDVLFAGCHFTGAARVNVIPGVSQTNKGDFNPFTTPFWNPSAFAVPAAFTFGDEPRSLASARFFGTKNEDFTVGKKTRLWGEHATLDFRAEFFDAFNRHIFVPNVGGPQLGTQDFTPPNPSNPACPGPLACGFGAVTSTTGPRNIQFGLILTY